MNVPFMGPVGFFCNLQPLVLSQSPRPPSKPSEGATDTRLHEQGIGATAQPVSQRCPPRWHLTAKDFYDCQ